MIKQSGTLLIGVAIGLIIFPLGFKLLRPALYKYIKSRIQKKVTKVLIK